jgi:hypothetical protein
MYKITCQDKEKSERSDKLQTQKSKKFFKINTVAYGYTQLDSNTVTRGRQKEKTQIKFPKRLVKILKM